MSRGLESVDRFLRREDSFLAQAVQRISPEKGGEYRDPLVKRAAEVVIAAPMAVAGVPIVSALATLIELDGGSPFYLDTRIDQEGKPFSIIKLRSMRVGSEPDETTSLLAAQYDPEQDPRNTKLGKILREYDIDELPQIFQVLSGKLALVGIRAVAPYAKGFMQDGLPADQFAQWEEAYEEGKPGLINLNAVISHNRKDDIARLRADLFYAEHKSLGFDLYIIFRLGSRIFSKFKEKLSKSSHTFYSYRQAGNVTKTSSGG